MKTLTSSLETSHFPVMLNEVINISSPKKGGFFVDCTFGGGGYSKSILEYPKTKLIGIDRDKSVTFIAKKLEKKFKNRFQFFQVKFSQIDKILKENADTIIFDLGLSSLQLKNLSRGFSFHSQDKLDMAMGLSDFSAKEVVNNLSEIQLKSIIKILGEEQEAKIIAKSIVKARSNKKITKVHELVKIIEKSKKIKFPSKINPSTKTFQALRIFVNKEITELMNGMVNATKYLKPGGKIIIVTFHSIEDKIVKFFFKNFSKNKSNPSRYLPEENSKNSALFENYVNRIIRPTKEEIRDNYPSRSAKLRFAVRSKNNFFYPNIFYQKFNKYLRIEAYNV